MARIVGYARVSTAEQSTDSQHDALRKAGCAEHDMWTDHGVSGRLAARPQWDACRAQLQPGDVLTVTKLDRLGRSLRNLIELVAELRSADVDLVILNMGIDTRTPNGRLVFHVMAAVAEWESDLNAERTRDGLAAAKARGKLGGRPASLKPWQVANARQWNNEGTSVAEIADRLEVSRATIYRHLDPKLAK